MNPHAFTTTKTGDASVHNCADPHRNSSSSTPDPENLLAIARTLRQNLSRLVTVQQHKLKATALPRSNEFTYTAKLVLPANIAATLRRPVAAIEFVEQPSDLPDAALLLSLQSQTSQMARWTEDDDESSIGDWSDGLQAIEAFDWGTQSGNAKPEVAEAECAGTPPRNPPCIPLTAPHSPSRNDAGTDDEPVLEQADLNDVNEVAIEPEREVAPEPITELQPASGLSSDGASPRPASCSGPQPREPEQAADITPQIPIDSYTVPITPSLVPESPSLQHYPLDFESNPLAVEEAGAQISRDVSTSPQHPPTDLDDSEDSLDDTTLLLQEHGELRFLEGIEQAAAGGFDAAVASPLLRTISSEDDPTHRRREGAGQEYGEGIEDVMDIDDVPGLLGDILASTATRYNSLPPLDFIETPEGDGPEEYNSQLFLAAAETEKAPASESQAATMVPRPDEISGELDEVPCEPQPTDGLVEMRQSTTNSPALVSQEVNTHEEDRADVGTRGSESGHSVILVSREETPLALVDTKNDTEVDAHDEPNNASSPSVYVSTGDFNMFDEEENEASQPMDSALVNTPKNTDVDTALALNTASPSPVHVTGNMDMVDVENDDAVPPINSAPHAAHSQHSTEETNALQTAVGEHVPHIHLLDSHTVLPPTDPSHDHLGDAVDSQIASEMDSNARAIGVDIADASTVDIGHVSQEVYNDSTSVLSQSAVDSDEAVKTEVDLQQVELPIDAIATASEMSTDVGPTVADINDVSTMDTSHRSHEVDNSSASVLSPSEVVVDEPVTREGDLQHAETPVDTAPVALQMHTSCAGPAGADIDVGDAVTRGIVHIIQEADDESAAVHSQSEAIGEVIGEESVTREDDLQEVEVPIDRAAQTPINRQEDVEDMMPNPIDGPEASREEAVTVEDEFQHADMPIGTIARTPSDSHDEGENMTPNPIAGPDTSVEQSEGLVGEQTTAESVAEEPTARIPSDRDDECEKWVPSPTTEPEISDGTLEGPVVEQATITPVEREVTAHVPVITEGSVKGSEDEDMLLNPAAGPEISGEEPVGSIEEQTADKSSAREPTTHCVKGTEDASSLGNGSNVVNEDAEGTSLSRALSRNADDPEPFHGKVDLELSDAEEMSKVTPRFKIASPPHVGNDPLSTHGPALEATKPDRSYSEDVHKSLFLPETPKLKALTKPESSNGKSNILSMNNEQFATPPPKPRAETSNKKRGAAPDLGLEDFGDDLSELSEVPDNLSEQSSPSAKRPSLSTKLDFGISDTTQLKPSTNLAPASEVPATVPQLELVKRRSSKHWDKKAECTTKTSEIESLVGKRHIDACQGKLTVLPLTQYRVKWKGAPAKAAYRWIDEDDVEKAAPELKARYDEANSDPVPGPTPSGTSAAVMQPISAHDGDSDPPANTSSPASAPVPSKVVSKPKSRSKLLPKPKRPRASKKDDADFRPDSDDNDEPPPKRTKKSLRKSTSAAKPSKTKGKAKGLSLDGANDSPDVSEDDASDVGAESEMDEVSGRSEPALPSRHKAPPPTEDAQHPLLKNYVAKTQHMAETPKQPSASKVKVVTTKPAAVPKPNVQTRRASNHEQPAAVDTAPSAFKAKVARAKSAAPPKPNVQTRRTSNHEQPAAADTSSGLAAASSSSQESNWTDKYQDELSKHGHIGRRQTRNLAGRGTDTTPVATATATTSGTKANAKGKAKTPKSVPAKRKAKETVPEEAPATPLRKRLRNRKSM